MPPAALELDAMPPPGDDHAAAPELRGSQPRLQILHRAIAAPSPGLGRSSSKLSNAASVPSEAQIVSGRKRSPRAPRFATTDDASTPNGRAQGTHNLFRRKRGYARVPMDVGRRTHQTCARCEHAQYMQTTQ